MMIMDKSLCYEYQDLSGQIHTYRSNDLTALVQIIFQKKNEIKLFNKLHAIKIKQKDIGFYVIFVKKNKENSPYYVKFDKPFSFNLNFCELLMSTLSRGFYDYQLKSFKFSKNLSLNARYNFIQENLKLIAIDCENKYNKKIEDVIILNSQTRDDKKFTIIENEQQLDTDATFYPTVRVFIDEATILSDQKATILSIDYPKILSKVNSQTNIENEIIPLMTQIKANGMTYVLPPYRPNGISKCDEPLPCSIL